jgi:hypothetical protein
VDGAAEVSAGDLVTVNVDVVMANDVTAPIAIESFNAIGVGEVFDRNRVMLVPSHFAPNKDIKSAEQTRTLNQHLRETAKVLGNTLAVCRKYYVHPKVVDAWQSGTLARHAPRSRPRRGLDGAETATLRFLSS